MAILPPPIKENLFLRPGVFTRAWERWFNQLFKLVNSNESDIGTGNVDNLAAYTSSGGLTDSGIDKSDVLEPSDIDGTTNEITVTNDGDGTVTISIPNTFLPNYIAGTTNQITVADDGDGTITLSLPQDINSGASPTFDGNNFTGIDADDVDISDAGGIITATDVEGALQENRTAINLNTTHSTGDGSDHADVASNTAARHTQGTDTALGVLGTKNPPIDADKAIYRDSTSSDALVTSTWSQIKAFLKTYFDTLYGTVAAVALNTTHRSSNGSDHTYIDQDVTTTGTPTFTSINLGDETMSTYDEGTFTPKVADASSGGNEASAATTSARYIKIGKIVHFQISIININTTGLTAGNQIFITGMPFTSVTWTNGAIGFLVVKSQVTSTEGSIVALMLSNTNYLSLYNEISGIGGVNTALVSQINSTTGDLYITGTYEASS